MRLFVDILIDEVKEHEKYLIEENKNSWKKISNFKLRGLSTKKIFETDNNFYNNIFSDILESEEEFDIKENESQNYEIF